MPNNDGDLGGDSGDNSAKKDLMNNVITGVVTSSNNVVKKPLEDGMKKSKENPEKEIEEN